MATVFPEAAKLINTQFTTKSVNPRGQGTSNTGPSPNRELVRLHPHLDISNRKKLLFGCWGVPIGDQFPLEGYENYFRHYEEYCGHLPASLTNCTHEHLYTAVRALRYDRRESCEADLCSTLSDVCQDDRKIKDIIDFVGKAIMMVSLKEWEPHETLSEFFGKRFLPSSSHGDRYRFPLSFNARAFEKIAGINISWSKNILDHMKIGLKDTTLHIFPYVAVLHLYDEPHFSHTFPAGFTAETLQTLSLMLPVLDKPTAEWFDQKHRRLGLDRGALQCSLYSGPSSRRIQDFDFWRDRLIIAKDLFDMSQPSGLLYLWRDNRNKVQWYTFWIAIVVFWLTLIGIIEGALQVYRAYQPSNDRTGTEIGDRHSFRQMMSSCRH